MATPWPPSSRLEISQYLWTEQIFQLRKVLLHLPPFSKAYLEYYPDQWICFHQLAFNNLQTVVIVGICIEKILSVGVR